MKGTEDGWLNARCKPKTCVIAAPAPASSTPPFAPSRSARRSRARWPASPAIALSNLNNFAVGAHGPTPSVASNAFEAMYGESGDRILHATGDETFAASDAARRQPAQYKPAAGIEYPNNDFGKNMMQIAQLLKANLGVEAAFTDVGGWDTIRIRAA